MQTTYNAFPNEAVAGLVAWDSLRDVISGNNPNYPVKMGRVVAFDGGWEKCKPFDSEEAVACGVTLKDDKRVEKYFPAKSTVPVMRFGRIWVEAEQQMDFGDDVYICYAGRQQVQTIEFDAELVTDNVVSMLFNGEAVSVTFDTDHATTMGLLETALEAFEDVDSVTVDTNTLIIVTKAHGKSIPIANIQVTLGATQATATVTEVTSTIADEEAYGKVRKEPDGSLNRTVEADIAVIKGASLGNGEYLALLEIPNLSGGWSHNDGGGEGEQEP